MKKIFWSVLSLVLIFGAGCGYTAHSALPAGWQTVYVPPFANKIDYTTDNKRNLYLPLLEVQVRNGVISRFQFDGNLKVAKADDADLVLTGELIDYTRDAVRYTDNNDVLEYRIRIIVNLKLTEGKDGPLVWEEKGFAGESSFFVSGAQAKPESTAVNDAVTDLSRRIVERTIENW